LALKLSRAEALKILTGFPFWKPLDEVEAALSKEAPMNTRNDPNMKENQMRFAKPTLRRGHHVYRLEGRRLHLKDKEPVMARWPDGTTESCTLRIKNRKAYVAASHRSAQLWKPLEQVEIGTCSFGGAA
jgi:hypothetical protein